MDGYQIIIDNATIIIRGEKTEFNIHAETEEKALELTKELAILKLKGEWE